MKSERVKDIEYYLNLPYTFVLRRDDEGDMVAKIQELPGCSAHGEDADDAFENLREAQKLWIEDCLETGDPVPEPEPEEFLPSGKWVQRVPRTLHQRLVRRAKEENVSLNQLVTAILSEAIAYTGPEDCRLEFLTHKAYGVWGAWPIFASHSERKNFFVFAQHDVSSLSAELNIIQRLAIPKRTRTEITEADAYAKETHGFAAR